MSVLGTSIQLKKRVNPARLLRELRERLGVGGSASETHLHIAEAPGSVTMAEVQSVVAEHDPAERSVPSVERQLVELWKILPLTPDSEAGQMQRKVLEAARAGEFGRAEG